MNPMLKKIGLMACALLMLYGCKPTEKNYKAAYDAAMSKQPVVDDALEVDVEDLITVDGGRKETINGVTLLFIPETVKPTDSDNAKGEGGVGVAIGKYDMPTNARSQAKMLSETEPEAQVCTNGKGTYYVVVKRVGNSAEAADYISGFKQRHPGYPFVGLDGLPAIVTVF